MTKAMLLIQLLLACITLKAQQQFTIAGTIKAKKTGETLIGATIRSGNVSCVTNEYGFYSLTLAPGNHELHINNVGMQPKITAVVLDKNLILDIFLEEGQNTLAEVLITASTRGRNIKSPQMGIDELSTREIKNIPMLFGERDVLKAIQLLPGIKAAGEGNAGFYVRGGTADQNLILLDEAPVYNASHLLGFFSTFNSDAIKDVTVYKAGMPAQYGGRLSSVLDIKMNDGNNQDYNVSGGLGLISSKLNVEGPLQKDKSSFLVSARRTYADVFLKLSNDPSVSTSALYFYDLNAKLNYQFGYRDRLFLSGYFGADKLGLGEIFSLKWGNGTGTLRWNHIFNNHLFSNTSLIFSNYNYKVEVHDGSSDITLFSQVRDWNLKEELQWYPDNRHSIRLGVNSIFHTIRPGEISAPAGSNFNDQSFQRRYSWENTLYASDIWKLTPRLSLSYGLRLTAFSILGPGDFYNVNSAGDVTDTLHYQSGQFVKTYFIPEPRLATSYTLNELSSIKVSYVRNVQNLHLVANSTAASPTDKWIASTNIIKPEISDQLSVGYYRDIAKKKYEFTVEIYFKKMQNQIDYRDGANVYTTAPIETQLLYGKGRAYGMEWLLKRKTGKLTGWLSYTLAKTERSIVGINDNLWYNARQDRTHDISVVLMYTMNKKWSFSANWVFYTGDAVSFPSGKYIVGGQVYFYYTERNGYRMPNYHRLDLGATFLLRNKKHWSSELALSLYNAYGRENAYTIGFRQNKDDPSKTEAIQTTLFKYVPSISYNFKFK